MMKDFDVGDQYIVQGTPLHHGHIVTIVEPQSELHKARAAARKEGKRLSESGDVHQPGMVAAFDPAFPATLWWWFATHQLAPVPPLLIKTITHADLN